MHAAGIVPGLAEFAAAANVGDSEDDAAVEKAEAIGTEGDGHGDAVAAVTVKQERGAAVAGSVVAVDDRHGDFCAVGGDSVEAFAGVERWIVAAEDGLLLAQGAVAGADVEVEYGARSDEGFVGEADEGGVELGIGAERGVVSGFGEGDTSGSGEGGGRFACEIDDAEMRKALFAFDEDEMGAASLVRMKKTPPAGSPELPG